MSLSRSFMYAGVPSTVMSLWNVPDAATAQIMTAFYQSLKAGNTKDVALQQAKNNYLNNAISPELKHPFYWAGFIAAGDMQPLSFPDANLYWVGLSILSLLLIVGIIVYLNFRFRKTT